VQSSLVSTSALALVALAAGACRDAGASSPMLASAHPSLLHPETASPRRPQLDGAAFPDGVLALTWDDGPDKETLALARYLHDLHVSATFFVVGRWVHGVSDEPGAGADVEASGYDRLPVLGDLVRLGHRLGGHTKSHVLLSEVPTSVAAGELEASVRDLAPFLTNELPLFRAPGGAWNAEVASVMTESPLAELVGPVRWDVDEKDWDGSLACRDSPPSACEPGPLGPRVRPRVIAERYLARIEQRRRGIVLLHDRVGDVGSRYALDIAHALVPELERRGYVFAAPVLAFSTLRERQSPPDLSDAGEVATGDINCDGRLDTCTASAEGVRCALGTLHGSPAAATASTVWSPSRSTRLRLVDVNADGRADLCALDPGPVCGMAP
jgi:peptidoglycan/xylan/chitin deacetylase (PgdA/CDA1 family)